MAYATNTLVVSDQTGTAALTLAAPNAAGAGNGDAVDPKSILWIKNAAVGSITVTIKMTGILVDGQAVADKVITVGATTNMLIGPFTQNMAQTSGTNAGQVLIEYSSITSVTRAFLKTPW